MPRPQLQFMNFYAHLSRQRERGGERGSLPNCSYANELQSSCCYPKIKRVATRRGWQQRRGQSVGHALSSALRMCIGQRRRRNVLNYCIALIYIAAALARTSRRTRRPSGLCWLARQLHSVSPMQLSSALDTSPPPTPLLLPASSCCCSLHTSG